jgi:hypothetical protein
VVTEFSRFWNKDVYMFAAAGIFFWFSSFVEEITPSVICNFEGRNLLLIIEDERRGCR